jgi:DNA-directed RNA polymerase specialized sigma24 family protein
MAGARRNNASAKSPRPDSVEGVELVRSRLGNLDDRSQELLRLKFNEDLSYQEISGRTGLAVGRVSCLVHDALKTLAADLAKTGLAP